MRCAIELTHGAEGEVAGPAHHTGAEGAEPLPDFEGLRTAEAMVASRDDPAEIDAVNNVKNAFECSQIAVNV